MYVANLLADNSQELEKLKPCFASSCEYRISSYYSLPKNGEVKRSQLFKRHSCQGICLLLLSTSYSRGCYIITVIIKETLDCTIIKIRNREEEVITIGYDSENNPHILDQ